MQDTFQRSERLYFLPIGGTAMATLAGLLQAEGHRVEGVDSQLYPPMSDLLEALGIPVRLGWDPDAMPQGIDRVVIGNAVPRTNPEVRAVLERGLPYVSQAEAVARYLLGERRSLVVAGTHGKTTTTAMLGWILERAGTDPTLFVGGLLPWSRRSFRHGRGPYLVIEGDEYNTAFFDRSPKFVHYRPWTFLLGPVEFDHGDIYADEDAVVAAFRAGTARVPGDGLIVVDGASPRALEACRDAAAPVVRVGEGAENDARIGAMDLSEGGSLWSLEWERHRLDLSLPLPGRHNLANASRAAVAALAAGVGPEAVAAALAAFPGVVRRLEIVGEAAGITVVDDFAHHPTALRATVEAARQRWPDRRIVIAFEPRSLTAGRSLFQEAYAAALTGADVVLVAPVHHRDRIPEEERLDRGRLGRELEAAGVVAVIPEDGEDPVAALQPVLQPGDVMIGCSSGDFGGFHRRLLERIGDMGR